MTLEYNKPLQIKDEKGEILYTIKNLSLDAEYELENFSYTLEEVREKLLSGNKFITVPLKEQKLAERYLDLSIKVAEDKNKNRVEELEKERNKILEQLKAGDQDRVKKGKSIIRYKDILRATPKEILIEMVEWLKDNIKEFELKSYYDCALEINSIASAFRSYSTCKRNKDQSYNSCGYISRDKRRNFPIDFPALKSHQITVLKCPVWFYNSYVYLYDWYNLIKQSNKDITLLSMSKRIVFREFSNYLNLRQEYMLKKQRERNK